MNKFDFDQKMKLPIMFEKCFNYCTRLFTSNNNSPPPSTIPSRSSSIISHITKLDLPPNGSYTLLDPKLSADLLFFTKQPFCLHHLHICLPTVLLHHCEDILRLCPYLWSLTISTDAIPDFETLLLCVQITTHLRILYTTPQPPAALEDAIKIGKKFKHEFIEGNGFCSDFQCSFKFQLQRGIAYAWLSDKTTT